MWVGATLVQAKAGERTGDGLREHGVLHHWSETRISDDTPGVFLFGRTRTGRLVETLVIRFSVGGLTMMVSDWVRARCNRTYRSHNWAGKGTLSAIRGVTGEVAHWRPHPQQHTIAEIILHMAFWKELVATVLSGGNYYYAKSDVWRTIEPTDTGWRGAQEALQAAHHRLMTAVRRVRDRHLMKSVKGRRKYTVADLAVDIGTHDSYHVGQIFVLRRLHEVRTSPEGGTPM